MALGFLVWVTPGDSAPGGGGVVFQGRSMTGCWGKAGLTSPAPEAVSGVSLFSERIAQRERV